MEKQRYRQIQQVQFVIILMNALVSAAKIALGTLIHSASMSADGLHSLTDGLNNVVGMIGVYFAYQPKDEKHPYGHRKFETMTTLAISGLLIALALNVLKSAYERMLNPIVPEVNTLSFIVMLITILINVFVTVYEKKRGQALKSDFLISDAAHTFSDVFVSISVIGTLFAVSLGFPWVDTVVSVFIAFLIGKAALEIIKNGADILCDAKVVDPKKIEAIVYSFKEVCSCHHIRSHGRSDDIYIDLHILARKDMTLEESHALSHLIDDSLRKAISGVTDVSVHVEPVDQGMEDGSLN